MKTITNFLKTVSKHFLFPVAMVLLLLGQNVLQAQSNDQKLKLQIIAESAAEDFRLQKTKALRIADSLNLPVRIESDDGWVTELMRFENGMPIYYTTNNLGGAHTISTSKVWPGGSAGLSLDGSGQVLGIWDGGGVRGTHQEMTGRVSHPDGSNTSIDDHATHVAGTMIATGVVGSAQGMANQADLVSFDWNNDLSEMAVQAGSGLQASNHSYGSVAGWEYGTWAGSPAAWYWWGYTYLSGTIDYKFGFYDSKAKAWDELAENAPNYLIVKSAGNHRNDAHTGQHYIWDGSAWVISNVVRPPDGGVTGFDCIPTAGVAKNILTVGAVEEIANGYNQPADVLMSSFSSWGPADDGRIKPDLVAKGVSVYSTESGNDSDYGTMSGTSMASPMVTGSIALLNQHYQNTHSAIMRSATMKALLIHTADEAGTTEGPDYKFGWGLMNTESAAEVISDDAAEETLHIREMSLDEDEIIELRIWPTGNEPLKATLAWTDPAGTPTTISLNPQDLMLVNDLDMRIIEVRSQSLFSPYMLDPQTPDAAATKGVNFRDNVEQIFVSSLPQAECPLYLLQIKHKGQLQNGSQDFSLIITGIQTNMIYVKKDASGSNDGTTWVDAYTNLQTAIDAAQAGEEIWVARGTYYPTGNGGGRHRHFNLKNCVEIYGGFVGDENANTFKLHDRNLLQNETILDGQGDCYHVVRSYANIDKTAVMDGFTVTGGKADCTYPNPCNEVEDARGGGMFNKGSPTIRNSTFTGNYALTFGGGMLNMESSPSLINCTFNANSDPECGGGITNLGSSPFLINCLIHGNRASTGGGMCNDEGSNPTVINSTISSNFAVVKGGGIMSNYWSGSSATIQNSIIWDNRVDTYQYSEGHQIFVGAGNPPIELFSTLLNTGGNNVVGPVVADPQCIYVDPLFVSSMPAMLAPTSAGNYRLGYLSPAIDTGLNAYVPVQQINDRDWNQRIDSLVKIVDMGAYEYPKECAPPKNLAAKQITNFSADLWWTPGGSETSWEIEWGQKGFQQGSGTLITTFQNPYILNGLSPGTEYDFYIRGICPPYFTSQWTGPATFETPSQCDPPTNFMATVTTSEATLTWTEPNPPSSYLITITNTLTGLVLFNDWSLLPGTNSFMVTGLTSSTVYQADIRSWCGGGLYSSLQTILFTTLWACEPPTGLSVVPSATEVDLSWIEPAVPPQQGYEIIIRDGATQLVVFNGNAASGTNTFTATGLTPDTWYEADIRSDCGGGVYSPWQLQVQYFKTLQMTCDPVTGFHALLLSATDVELLWTEPVPPQDYEILVTDFTGVVVFNANASAGTNAFPLNGLTPSTDYFAEIRSDCGGGVFSPWQTIIFTTLSGVCDPPIGFTAQPLSATDVELAWIEPVPPPLNGYDITVMDNTGVPIFTGFASAGDNSFVVLGLTPATNYIAEIISHCGSGVYSSSVSLTFTTCTQFTVQAPADFEVCINEPAFALSGATPAGGTYTGNGVAGNNFNPALAGVGTHYITYTYTDAYGCSGSDTFIITVNDLPVVNCPADFSVFLYDNPFALTGGTPAGGIYTDDLGNMITSFDPFSAGPGNHKISYTFTDNNGCSAVCEFWIDVISNYDFGDAPDVPQGFNFHTLFAQNGARHAINPAVYLGDKIDAEADGQPTIDALGDDINNLGDEDGVLFSRFMAVGGMASVRVKASVDGYLNAWVDFNRDGNWIGAAEQIFTDEPMVAGWNTLSFAVPNNAHVGSSYARFRFNTTGGLSYQGAADDGEVEDYFVPILPQSWAFTITNLSHLILVPVSAVFPAAVIPDDIELEQGDFIAAFFDDQGSPKCGGALYIDGTDNQMLIAYGDDVLTNEKDGFGEEEQFSFKIYKAGTGEIIDVEASFDPDMPNFDGKFYNNGLSAITMFIEPGLSQTLAIPQGWSGISTYLEPLDTDVENMFSPVVGDLVILYNDDGMYWPGENTNSLGQWDAHKGYLIKMANDATLDVAGEELMDVSLDLAAGWNIVPVLSAEPFDIGILFNSLPGFIAAKEVAGIGVYLPGYGINTIGNMVPGNAYYAYTSQAGSVSFILLETKSTIEFTAPIEPVSPWNLVSHTPESHIVVFNTQNAPFMEGDIVGGFTDNGYCAGLTAVNPNGTFTLTLNRNDAFTDLKTGFQDGEILNYRVYRPATGDSFVLDVVYNPAMTLGNFTTNGLSEVTEVKASALSVGNLSASQISIYPNPSSGKFNIAGVDGLAQIEVSNAYGKLMLRQTLDIRTGIDLSSYPNGVYLLKITTNNDNESMHKLIVH